MSGAREISLGMNQARGARQKASCSAKEDDIHRYIAKEEDIHLYIPTVFINVDHPRLDPRVITEFIERVNSSSSRAEFEIKESLAGADKAMSAEIASAVFDFVDAYFRKYGGPVHHAFARRLREFGLAGKSLYFARVQRKRDLIESEASAPGRQSQKPKRKRDKTDVQAIHR